MTCEIEGRSGPVVPDLDLAVGALVVGRDICSLDVADDEVVLAELRAQQVTSAERLADALGMEADVLVDQMDRLYSAGAVLRMGTGEAARYRAA